MEPTRNKTKVEQVAPVDFGVSSDSGRRCKTCACHIAIQNPRVIGQSQSLCRRDPVQLVQTPGQGVSLTYPPTQPDLVCFDGWRPVDVAPGEPEYARVLCCYPMADGSECILNSGHEGIHKGPVSA